MSGGEFLNKNKLLMSAILLIAVMFTAMSFTPTIAVTSNSTVTSTVTCTVTIGPTPYPYPCGLTTVTRSATSSSTSSTSSHSTTTTTTTSSVSAFNVPCGAGYTKTPIINVQYTVLNDEDSGNVAYWALDNYQKSVIVWQGSGENSHRFCALVQYLGSGNSGWFGPTYGFQTYAGAKSPGFGVTQVKDGSGSFTGAYYATFTANVNASSTKAKTGNIGTVDFKGTKADILAGTPGAQFAPVSWTTYYFTNVAGFNYLAWGWVYTYNPPTTFWGAPTSTTGYYGQMWVNSNGGTFGDIITS